jgi:hypothetical protein
MQPFAAALVAPPKQKIAANPATKTFMALILCVVLFKARRNALFQDHSARGSNPIGSLKEPAWFSRVVDSKKRAGHIVGADRETERGAMRYG